MAARESDREHEGDADGGDQGGRGGEALLGDRLLDVHLDDDPDVVVERDRAAHHGQDRERRVVLLDGGPEEIPLPQEAGRQGDAGERQHEDEHREGRQRRPALSPPCPAARTPMRAYPAWARLEHASIRFVLSCRIAATSPSVMPAADMSTGSGVHDGAIGPHPSMKTWSRAASVAALEAVATNAVVAVGAPEPAPGAARIRDPPIRLDHPGFCGAVLNCMDHSEISRTFS
jgi:hypothetical protein